MLFWIRTKWFLRCQAVLDKCDELFLSRQLIYWVSGAKRILEIQFSLGEWGGGGGGIFFFKFSFFFCFLKDK